jgi:hypothetical protein
MNAQLSFDLDIEPVYFTSLSAADRCRDCGRKVEGRWSRCWQGCDMNGFWVVCDDCNPLGPVPR